MGNKTPLYEKHLEAGAKIVDFGGWDMPINYGSQIEEHHQVRKHAGMFDVSHMTVVDVSGAGSRDYLRYLLANDVDKLAVPGKALYSAMLNHDGGVIDDLIVYLMEDGYRLVVNCATREKDLAWMQLNISRYDATITERPELAMIAVQGPESETIVTGLLEGEEAAGLKGLKPFSALAIGEVFYARTGYTGEDGFEIILPAGEATGLWQSLLDAGVKPCGLGARDTLRLEAGMNLYGNDMDEDVSPLAANMGWTVAWEPAGRDFLGRAALEEEKGVGTPQVLVGLVMEQKGVLRAHQKVMVETASGEQEGEITSGTFSPTLGYSIALARIPVTQAGEARVDIRGRMMDVKIVTVPFVRKGEKVYRQV